MAKARKGDVYSCEVCGLIVVVDEVCGCATADLLCCKAPMGKGKAAAVKARKKALALKAPAAKPAAKAKAKPAKKAAPKAAVKKAAPKKPAAKAKKRA